MQYSDKNHPRRRSSDYYFRDGLLCKLWNRYKASPIPELVLAAIVVALIVWFGG